MIPDGPRGLFIKTPAPQIVELIALERPDFAVIDAEHGPFDRAMIDLMMLAGRAARLPLFVRVPDAAGHSIGSALDLGAAGVMVPHIASVEAARDAVGRARYVGGTRGFSSAPRHASYGSMTMRDIIATGDRSQVLVQVEHPEAAARARDILEVDGVDGIVVGRADLAIAMGEGDTAAPVVEELVLRIFSDVRDSQKIKGVVVSSEAERQRYAQLGANWFIMGNDQSLLRKALRQLLSA
ncbi:aldolase [Altererythrobacter sp. B11]|uniref:HpcH/HpaI aldolase family protein n=1 Tax=Altererythrobacter sp. B11 TaxID=2060312 RepID=UPI000DC6FF4B|nr:aldolase/citrate lyase family protein [Altererythrobacter sp. B11]BBC71010.1 aldolase [Altererythrobacter sp. B11]